MGYRVSVWGLWCRGRQQWSSRSQCMVQDVCFCVHDVESVRNPGGLLAAALVFTCLCFWRGPMVPASCSTPANILWNITGRPRITSWSLASATQATHVIPSSLLVPLMRFLRVCLFIVLCRWLHAIAELADRPGSYRHGRRTTLCCHCSSPLAPSMHILVAGARHVACLHACPFPFHLHLHLICRSLKKPRCCGACVWTIWRDVKHLSFAGGPWALGWHGPTKTHPSCCANVPAIFESWWGMTNQPKNHHAVFQRESHQGFWIQHMNGWRWLLIIFLHSWGNLRLRWISCPLQFSAYISEFFLAYWFYSIFQDGDERIFLSLHAKHPPAPVRCNWIVFACRMRSTTEFAMTVLSKCVCVFFIFFFYNYTVCWIWSG